MTQLHNCSEIDRADALICYISGTRKKTEEEESCVQLYTKLQVRKEERATATFVYIPRFQIVKQNNKKSHPSRLKDL